jgi:DNA-directed RNA polymerase subunit RPC12/RpoP
MNIPSAVGSRYLCFVVVKRGRGWGGSYGQTYTGPIWECVECGHRIAEYLNGFDRMRAAKHHEHGHAPCPDCGKPVLLRKDGSRRQHRYDLCAGKTDGHKIEREFAKNITTRELT